MTNKQPDEFATAAMVLREGAPSPNPHRVEARIITALVADSAGAMLRTIERMDGELAALVEANKHLCEANEHLHAALNDVPERYKQTKAELEGLREKLHLVEMANARVHKAAAEAEEERDAALANLEVARSERDLASEKACLVSLELDEAAEDRDRVAGRLNEFVVAMQRIAELGCPNDGCGTERPCPSCMAKDALRWARQINTKRDSDAEAPAA